MIDKTTNRAKRLAQIDRAIIRAAVVLPAIGFLIGVWLLATGAGISLCDLLLLIVMYALTMIGVEVGFHRYFTHRSFKAKPWVEALLAVLGSMAFQGPVIWWTATHRRHHALADRPGDPHSPVPTDGSLRARVRGLLHAHFLWLLSNDHAQPEHWSERVSDWYRNKTVLAVQLSYMKWAMLGLVIPALIGGLVTLSWTGACTAFLWGGLVRVFLTHHAMWSLNSICHLFGTRPFPISDDTSRNNVFIAVATFGQGWHNNHHAFPSSFRAGLEWWQLDIGAWVIKALIAVGAAWEARDVSPTMPVSRGGRHELYASELIHTRALKTDIAASTFDRR